MWQALADREVLKLCAAYFLWITGFWGFNYWMPTTLKEVSGWSNAFIGQMFAVAMLISLAVSAYTGHSSSVRNEKRWHGAFHMFLAAFAVAAGGLVHAWQRMPDARYNPRAIEWAYWLLVAGVLMMVVDLTSAGIVEAQLWQPGTPWLDSVNAAKPFWLVRALSAVPIAAGFIALLVGLTSGPRGGGLGALEEPLDPDAVDVVTARLAAAGADAS